MMMYLVIYRWIVVYILKDMLKDKRKFVRLILFMFEDFLVKVFLLAVIMLKMSVNCMKYGKKGLMKMLV